MDTVIAVGLGFVETAGIGAGSRQFLGRMWTWVLARTPDGKVPYPPGVSPTDWDQLLVPKSVGDQDMAGVWQGCFERVIFFATFWVGAWIFGGAWLVFKTAAKWNQFSQMAEMPKQDQFGPTAEMQRLRAQHFRMALEHGRFVLGTAFNVVAALIGVGVGKAVEIFLITKSPLWF